LQCVRRLPILRGVSHFLLEDISDLVFIQIPAAVLQQAA
jgi:hypothetical protein